MMALEERGAFIRQNTRILPVPYVPELHLYMADEATALWGKTEDALATTGLPPPFWAFPWAGGQALARYILDHETVVRGRRVLDVASGSGLVAVAAARAGAAAVEANDIDDFALTAIALNAECNAVDLTITAGDLIGTDAGWDVVLAGDIFYERDTAARMTQWLAALAARGASVLIGDPGRSYLDRSRLEPIANYRVPVNVSLEDANTKQTSVWRFRGA